MSGARMRWRGGRALEREREALADGVEDAVQILFDASQDLVPIETHRLQDSGVASVDRAALRGAVSYGVGGGEIGIVAVRQHEVLTYYEHDEGRSSKYLEKPLYSHRRQMLEAIADQLRQALR